VKELHIGMRQRHPAPQVTQHPLHAIGLLLGEKEARLFQPVLIMLGQLLHLNSAGQSGSQRSGARRLYPFPMAAPLIGNEQDALREVYGRESGVCRNPHDGIRPGDIIVFQTGAFRPEQHGNSFASRKFSGRFTHRALRRQDPVREIAVTGSGRVNGGSVSDGVFGATEYLRAVQNSAGTARHGHGARVRPTVTRCHQPHPGQPEIRHGAGRSADILSKLRTNKNETGLNLHLPIELGRSYTQTPIPANRRGVPYLKFRTERDVRAEGRNSLHTLRNAIGYHSGR